MSAATLSNPLAPMLSPAPEVIIKARHTVGLTQTQAADLVHYPVRQWQRWEAGDQSMHPAVWELFVMKVTRK